MKKLDVKIRIKEALSKMNESPSDCQDALATNPQTGRFAVADGVARSFFPAEWSSLLVNQFCLDASDLNSTLFNTQNWQDWLNPIQEKWSALIQEKVSKKTGMASVHLRNSLLSNEPAASTFTGIQIKSNRQGVFEWQGMIIGDSCLFHFRDNKLESYLVSSSLDFNFHPEYFSSVPIGKNFQPTFKSGTFESGDIFILATDALSKWILNQYERGGATWEQTWESLMSLQNWKDLYAFVANARERKENSMDDDDVALIILSCVEVKSIQSIEVFDKSSQRNDPFITPTSKSPIPVPQAAPSIQGLPDQVVKNEKDNIPSKPPSKISKLSVFATALSLVSLIFSMASFYLVAKNTIPASSTPTVVPTLTEIPPTSDIVTPTEFHQSTITLPVNSIIYMNPDSQSQTLMTVQSEFPVLVTENKDNWVMVQSDVWILITAAETESIIIEDNLIKIQNPISIYLSPSINPVSNGLLAQGSGALKISEYTDTIGTWYQIRVIGFVVGN